MSVFYGKRGKTRRLIMQNSKALLETHGIEHVTMQDIADAANVSRTTVFNYFGSVKGVLDALCEDEVNAVREYCERKEKREDNRPDVRHVFEQLIKDAADFPALIIRVISASIVEPGGCNPILEIEQMILDRVGGDETKLTFLTGGFYAVLNHTYLHDGKIDENKMMDKMDNIIRQVECMG